MAGILGDIHDVPSSQDSIEIESLARFAVEDYNKTQNALLEFGKVVNVKKQVVSGTVYYITLEATDGGKKKIYETKIWEKPWLNFKEVKCRSLSCLMTPLLNILARLKKILSD